MSMDEDDARGIRVADVCSLGPILTLWRAVKRTSGTR
jgi:hypothetical protein